MQNEKEEECTEAENDLHGVFRKCQGILKQLWKDVLYVELQPSHSPDAKSRGV